MTGDRLNTSSPTAAAIALTTAPKPAPTGASPTPRAPTGVSGSGMSSAAERSVSEVALDCGFCHLSQFAADYKRVFLESPSATRRAVGRSRLSRVAHYEAGPVAFAAR